MPIRTLLITTLTLGICSVAQADSLNPSADYNLAVPVAEESRAADTSDAQSARQFGVVAGASVAVVGVVTTVAGLGRRPRTRQPG